MVVIPGADFTVFLNEVVQQGFEAEDHHRGQGRRVPTTGRLSLR